MGKDVKDGFAQSISGRSYGQTPNRVQLFTFESAADNPQSHAFSRIIQPVAKHI
jgi:hypothetical protein